MLLNFLKVRFLLFLACLLFMLLICSFEALFSDCSLSDAIGKIDKRACVRYIFASLVFSFIFPWEF